MHFKSVPFVRFPLFRPSGLFLVFYAVKTFNLSSLAFYKVCRVQLKNLVNVSLSFVIIMVELALLPLSMLLLFVGMLMCFIGIY